MDKWLSVSQLSEVTEIPETTLRRYTNKFNKYFRYEQRSRGKRFHPESIEVLNRISALYSEGFEAEEIDNALGKYFPMTIEDEETTKQTPIKSMEKQFNDFREQQEEFNSQLLRQIQKQQEYIKNSLEKRDRELTNTMKEMLAAKKELIATKEDTTKTKGFWSRFFRQKENLWLQVP